MDELVKKTMESLERRGFHVAYAEKAEQARDMALQMIAPGESVGIGGSMTIRELGLAERLQENGARQCCCKYAFVDTFSFQAPAFYEKHGYREVFTLEDYPYTEKRHYYTKAL